MSAYKLAFYEAVTLLGVKKALAEFLSAAQIADEGTVGQVVIHLNNGGVTKIVKATEVK